MERRANEYLNNADSEIDHLLTRGPVIFFKWYDSSRWPVRYISPNVSQIGYCQEDFLDGEVMLSDIIHPEDLEHFSQGLRHLRKHSSSLGEDYSDYSRGEIRLLSSCENIYRLFHFTVCLYENEAGEPSDCYCGCFVELGDYWKIKKGKEADIEYQAYHDSLTGLPNRSLFNDRLEMEIRRAGRSGKKFGVMFLDLDDFKNINDSLGHVAGDYLLQHAGRRLMKSVRDVDTVGRIGGDEFTVLLPQISDPKEIAHVAERIVEVFRKPFIIQDHELYSTVSIGICIYPNDGNNAIELMKNSDLAMYHAKEQGKNSYVFFSETMNLQMKKRLELENRLRIALAEDQFVLHYQPLVELKSGNIVGVEALVRWNHPDSGLIQPVEFINLAEETGMILRLGQWVLQNSCQQNLVWQKQMGDYNSLYVSVNISCRQFFRSDFLESLKHILESTGLKNHSLSLQVTENSIIGNRDKIVGIMNMLKKIGIRLAIDDFGMGFSSLNYLRCFPVDTIKIDRTFIHGIPHESHCTGITASVIALSRNLGIKVLAEGVENKEQLDFLVENKCDLVQGYYFSPPVPPEQISLMLKEKKNLYDI